MNSCIFSLLILLGLMNSAVAGVFEVGGGFSYQHNTYNGGSYTWTKTVSANVGYYFTEDSEFQISYQDSTNEESVPGVSTITYRDRVYSANFLYHLFDVPTFKPYLRLGVGQLNRDATGSYQGGYSPPGRLDQLTEIAGIGIKAKIGSRFSIKAEAVTYLSGTSFSSWRDNVNVSVGGSVYF